MAPRKPLSVWQQALKDAARELSMPKDSWPVERFATLRIALQLARSKWASGNTTASADLLTLMAEITQLRANAGLDVPRSVDVQIVRKLRGKCCHCGAWNEVPEAQIRAVISAHPESTPEATHGLPNGSVQGSTGDETAAKNAPPVPVSAQRPGVSASKFHAQLLNGHEVAPLKRTTRRLSPISEY
jgi:hypothetical protein